MCEVEDIFIYMGTFAFSNVNSVHIPFPLSRGFLVFFPAIFRYALCVRDTNPLPYKLYMFSLFCDLWFLVCVWWVYFFWNYKRFSFLFSYLTKFSFITFGF